MALLRVDDPHRLAGGAHVGHHQFEHALAEQARGQQVRRLGNAQPLADRLDHRLAVVDQQVGVDVHLDPPVRSVELPLPRLAVRVHVVDAAMVPEVLDTGRGTMPREVIGRGEHHVAQVTDLVRDVAGVLQLADADRAIDALAVEVAGQVAHQQLEPDVGIALLELGQARDQRGPSHAQ
ncbi:hypothetical protein ATSB10_29930 [Dyella thiooxydans]|uniref:Uncharacterized protein n=1 Tax=Dyella thiooxydans TaxID=445710 RepID=A0A160N3U9_9GAMM|nr:hypothetical protein ATSB10_29930 [Dyella thiooxydans]